VEKKLVLAVSKTFAFVRLDSLNAADRDTAIAFLVSASTTVVAYNALRGNFLQISKPLFNQRSFKHAHD